MLKKLSRSLVKFNKKATSFTIKIGDKISGKSKGGESDKRSQSVEREMTKSKSKSKDNVKTVSKRKINAKSESR